jgi:adenylate kinase family enzyme
MSKLYIMIGPPGSGKSTIADELTQKENLVKVSLD